MWLRKFIASRGCETAHLSAVIPISISKLSGSHHNFPGGMKIGGILSAAMPYFFILLVLNGFPKLYSGFIRSSASLHPLGTAQDDGRYWPKVKRNRIILTFYISIFQTNFAEGQICQKGKVVCWCWFV